MRKDVDVKRELPRGLLYLALASLAILSTILFGLLVKAHADGHFMEALGIIGFDEKIEAPEFTLKDLDGKAVSLSDYRGRILFLNFWATWCPPCRAEMLSMEK